MKILQVSSLFPPHIGGIEHHVWALSNRLAEEGHDVTVYTSNVPKSKKYEVLNGVEIHRLTCLFSPLNNQVIPGLFFKLISKNDFDIIHVHSHLHMSSNMTVFSKMFRKRPIVLTSHGIVEYRGWKNLVKILYNKTMAKYMLKSADKIIALSPTQANILEKLGANHSDITVIPNGIDLNRINLNVNADSFKDQYQLHNKKIVLFVGGLIPRKGVNYLIDAMKQVKSDCIALIVGGELQGHSGAKISLEEQVRKIGLKNILFLGKVSNEDLEYAYTIADVFVLPSLSEGLPLTLLEAMSYKKCVVVTDIPGNSDVIQDGENGILFEVGNSLDLGKMINYLLTNEELRKKLGMAARKEIEKNYNWNKNFNRILEVYGEVPK